MFTWPLALIGLISIPALLAIYFLRNRYRTQPVSSIIFWRQTQRPKQGGRYINLPRTSILLLLELLILALLTLAAANPLISAPKAVKKYVVVLDNSFSMLAGAQSSPRQRAVDKLVRLLNEAGEFRASFILAASAPTTLASEVSSVGQVRSAMEKWECTASGCRMGRSLAFARRIAGKQGHILVITDHKPDNQLGSGRIQWWAFGKSRANIAFINVSQQSSGKRIGFLLEVANLSDSAAQAEITIRSEKQENPLINRRINIGADKTEYLRFSAAASSMPARATIQADDPAMDNRIWLAGRKKPNVRVSLAIEDEVLSKALTKALAAVDSVTVVSSGAQMVFTDRQSLSDSAWNVRIASDPNISGFVGPFVTDYDHPVTEGLNLQGMVWAGAKDSELPGVPVITAGNVPLLTDRTRPGFAHNLYLNLSARHSTLLRTANWPILVANIVEFRRGSLPGLEAGTFPLSSEVRFNLPQPGADVILIGPDASRRTINTAGNTAAITPQVSGLYELRTADKAYQFAVNRLAKNESDLRNTTSGQWGSWDQAGLYWWQYRPIGWIAALAALLLLVVHRMVNRYTRSEKQ